MARTARQRAALKKAQAASARKRRGKGKGKLAKANRRLGRARFARNLAIGVAGGVAVGTVLGRKTGNILVQGGAYSGRKRNGITVNRKSRAIVVRGGGRYAAAAFPKAAGR